MCVALQVNLETLSDHEDTLSLMEAVRFDQAFMFAYSPRPGIPSALVAESITPEEKGLRLQEIIDLQLRHSRERVEEQVGKVEPVLLVPSPTQARFRLSLPWPWHQNRV